MIRGDIWLKQNAKKLGINPDNVNPNSVNLTLGTQAVVFAPELFFNYDSLISREVQANGWSKQPLNIPAQCMPLGASRSHLDACCTFYEKTYNLQPDQKFMLYPSLFYLLHAEETITVPQGYTAIILLRSKAARSGANHYTALWFDTGFYGQPTLEVAAHMPLLLTVGQPDLVQLIYISADYVEKDYQEVGHYYGQMGATKAKVIAPAP